MNPGRSKPTFDVYVGNLPSTADEEGLKRLFGSYGGIHSVLLKDGKQTGTKFGFVRYFEEDGAQKAVSDASGKYVNGKVLLVKKAERNPNNKFSGSGGGGGSGGCGFGGGGGGTGGFGSSGDASNKPGFKEGGTGKDGTSARTRGMRQDNGPAAATHVQNLTVIGEESVMLTHASNACSVYVQMSSQASIEQSSKLMVEMQEYCLSAPKITSKPERNVLYGAVFSEDGLWYRCKVLAYGQSNPKEAHVRYIDYGNEEVTDATKMVQLAGELATYKPQACRLHLHGLKPTCTAISNAEEHKRAVNFLMGVADNKFITARLYKPLVHGDESAPCELHCEGQNLNRLMRDHGFAAPLTPAASPKRGPDQQQSPQNGVSSGHAQSPRQQRQMGGQNQQQNRQQTDGQTQQQNRQSGQNQQQNRQQMDGQTQQQNRQQSGQNLQQNGQNIQQIRHGQNQQQNRQQPSGQNQQQNRQQTSGQNQQQNRQQTSGQNQGSANRQQGSVGNKPQTSRNDAQLENANREIRGLKGDISTLDRQLLALKTENEGLQSLLSTAVQAKVGKLQKSFEKVRTLRKEMPLDVTVDGVIETAINLLQNTEMNISKKVLNAQEVMAANDRLEECQENLRKTTDKELLPDLMVARNEARQETFQAITSFLSKTKSLPLLDRQEKVKPTSGPPLALTYYSEDVSIALECTEAKYFDLLAADKEASANKEGDSGHVEACIQEYTQWKTDNCTYLNGIRSTTDLTLALWTSLLAKLLLSFGIERDEDIEPVESTDELIDKLMVAIDTELYMSQKNYSPIVTLDPSLHKTKQQKETIKTGVLTKTVCCLTKQLRKELASIETLTELYNHHEKLSKELEPWMNSKPDVTDMQTVQRDIKGLRSRLRHKLADKHDMEESPELCEEKNKESLNDELDKIRCALQAAYATEDKQLVDLAALTKRHFPELALLNPTFRINDYLETNGLLKYGRDLQQFDLQPLPSTKSSIVKSGQFNGQNIIIKSYNVTGEDMRKSLLINAVQYSHLDIDRLLHIQAIIPTSELADQLHFQLPQLPLNLVRTVKETNPTALQLQTIFKDVVTGLKALHDLDVIYGALHPENILITDDVHAVLADYDFSKTPTERAQQGYKADNGLHFTAPEINCGLEAHVASDMFAFGVSLLYAHYPDTAFTMQPDGTPDIASITMEPELGDIIKQLINYSQAKRPHSDAVLSSAYFTLDIQKREEEEQKRKEEEQRIKEEEERKKKEAEEQKKREEEEQKKREEEEQKKREEEAQKKREEEEQKKKEEEEEQKRLEEEEQKKKEEQQQEVTVKEEITADDDDDDGPPALETEEEEVDLNQNKETEVKKAEEETKPSQGVESSL